LGASLCGRLKLGSAEVGANRRDPLGISRDEIEVHPARADARRIIGHEQRYASPVIEMVEVHFGSYW